MHIMQAIVAIHIPERNRQILQMRKEGVRRSDVARKFNVSPSRIYLIEQQSRADRGTAERRVKLREQVVNVDDLDALWAVEDLVDAIGVTVLTKKRLMEHFVEVAKKEISLRELMDMCPEAPVEGLDFMISPLQMGAGRRRRERCLGI